MLDKFSVRGLQTEFYRSSSTHKSALYAFPLSNLRFFALLTGKVFSQALHKADIASLLHARTWIIFPNYRVEC